MAEILSVQPDWCLRLPLQQQSVLLLAARGPDGIRKHHPCKDVVRHYRGTVLLAARYGRMLRVGESADTFMSCEFFADDGRWSDAVETYYDAVDELPHHYHMHLLHGAQILGYKHPDLAVARCWSWFYIRGVRDAHLSAETQAEMDRRLSDWDREHWTDD